MLDMRPPGNYRDFHVSNVRTCQYPWMRALRKMCIYQPLPISIELILAAKTVKYKSAARLTRLKQKMHLRIMPQWLKMAYAHRRRCYGLLVYGTSLSKFHSDSEALFYHMLQNFKRKLAHHMDIYLSRLLVPENAQRRLFLLKLSKLPQKYSRIGLGRNYHLI